jgi:tRNA(Arg) A34 adenosine deaminase TadA
MAAGIKLPAAVKHSRYINMLSKLAADITNPVAGNARLAACVVHRNDIIAFGVNEMKSHPFQAKYGKNSNSVYLHAETSAIKNALKYISQDELSKSTLYICRIKYHDADKKSMVFGLSRPCPGCFRCINTFNIKQVVYTLDNEGISVL